jgi:hypothetical protein
MRALSTNAPTNVAAIDERDPNAGGASHAYGVQWGGPKDVTRIQFQHGPRGLATSTPGLFDDDLLAILQDRLECFQDGPFACEENDQALRAVRSARFHLGQRVARRIAQGVLGENKEHRS